MAQVSLKTFKKVMQAKGYTPTIRSHILGESGLKYEVTFRENKLWTCKMSHKSYRSIANRKLK